MDTLHTIWAFLATQGIDFGIKVIGAIAAWIIGRWLISLAARFMEHVFERAGRIDVTVAKYLATIVSGFLTLVLILALLGIFGIQTTSFVALLAGLGLAIGTAWGGLLAHFAAGVFLQILRPFKVGDFVTAAAVTGTVREIGLFVSKIVTPDNVETIVGNNAIFSATIQNYSTLPFRRVECTAKIANGVDPRDAMERLRPAIAAIPNVETRPAPARSSRYSPPRTTRCRRRRSPTRRPPATARRRARPSRPSAATAWRAVRSRRPPWTTAASTRRDAARATKARGQVRTTVERAVT
jgi:small conductance mechanosensitive channel